MLGHNRDGKICRVCGKIHIHPRGMLGKQHSKESKEKIAESHRGKHPSEETRKKLSEAKKGDKHFNYGGHLSEEWKEKIGESIGKQWENGAYDEAYDSPEYKEKARNHLENQRLQGLLNIRKPTKPQIRLFEVIKLKYPEEEVMMECPIKTKEGVRLIDVAIPHLRIGFEYDEPYWHQNKEYDQKRHQLIEAEGWKLIHYKDEKEFSQKP